MPRLKIYSRDYEKYDSSQNLPTAPPAAPRYAAPSATSAVTETTTPEYKNKSELRTAPYGKCTCLEKYYVIKIC